MKEYIKEMTEFKNNQNWFMKNFDNILKKYSDMFVAVWHQSVLDVDIDLKSLQKRVCEKTKRAGSVYVEYVTDEPLELIL